MVRMENISATGATLEEAMSYNFEPDPIFEGNRPYP